jgi:uncharacterized protein (DUF362 family)
MNALVTGKETLVSIVKNISSYESSNVHQALEQLLFQLGLDERNAFTPRWNPLRDFISKGDKVLIKPNLIRQSHLYKPDWEHVITHGAVIAAVVQYVFRALDGTGKIIIADGPQTDSDFDRICEVLQLEKLKQHYLREYGYEIQILDLREERWLERDMVIVDRIKLPGDPRGYVEFDLGEQSEFANQRCNLKYYGADYDFYQAQKYHLAGHHRYRIARTALEADVFINLPKLKTHKKAGVTLSLKNIVGVHGDRNYLPHFVMGTPAEGGDEFPTNNVKAKLQSRMIRWFKAALVHRGGKGGLGARVIKKLGYLVFGPTKEVIRSGNWYGNDTTWRMTLDLNKILFYGNVDGTFRRQPRQKYLTIIDGIIGGEGDGPMAPDPKPCGVLIGGFNPVAVDTVGAILMGFDYRKIPTIKRAWDIQNFPLVAFKPEDIQCKSNVLEWSGNLFNLEKGPHLGFEPHFGWKGHIERDIAESLL